MLLATHLQLLKEMVCSTGARDQNPLCGMNPPTLNCARHASTKQFGWDIDKDTYSSNYVYKAGWISQDHDSTIVRGLLEPAHRTSAIAHHTFDDSHHTLRQQVCLINIALWLIEDHCLVSGPLEKLHVVDWHRQTFEWRTTLLCIKTPNSTRERTMSSSSRPMLNSLCTVLHHNGIYASNPNAGFISVIMDTWESSRFLWSLLFPFLALQVLLELFEAWEAEVVARWIEMWVWFAWWVYLGTTYIARLISQMVPSSHFQHFWDCFLGLSKCFHYHSSAWPDHVEQLSNLLPCWVVSLHYSKSSISWPNRSVKHWRLPMMALWWMLA